MANLNLLNKIVINKLLGIIILLYNLNAALVKFIIGFNMSVKVLTSFSIKQNKILTNWIFYTFILASLPFIASWILHILTGQFRWEIIKNTPEIMFFSIMLSSTTARDINDSSAITDKYIVVYILEKVLTFGSLISAVIYGWILYDNIVGPGSFLFRVNVFPLAIIVGWILFISSLSAKLLMIQNEGNK